MYESERRREKHNHDMCARCAQQWMGVIEMMAENWYI